MGVAILRPAPRGPIVWGVSTDYQPGEKELHARSDIDHGVYISDDMVPYVNVDTGEIKFDKK